MDENECLRVAVIVFQVGAVRTKEEECDSRRSLRLAEREIAELDNTAANLLEGVGNPRIRGRILRRLVLIPDISRRLKQGRGGEIETTSRIYENLCVLGRFAGFCKADEPLSPC